jgi:hypothetical protein
MASTEQPFVLDGTYEDHEWRELAADPEFRAKGRGNTRKVKEDRYRAGPRAHPYGPNAYLDEYTDESGAIVRRWFQNREARDQFVHQNEPDEEQLRTRQKPAASEGNPAQRQLEEASRRQARGNKTGDAG